MGSILALIVVLGTVSPVQGGRTLRLGVSGSSFSVTEPEGWRIDLTSAHQIANFVMHPLNTTWRESAVVAFGRFIPKKPKETLRTFLENDLKEFQLRCPFYETGEVDLEVRGSREFLTKALHCPSRRHEIVAVTEVPGFFIAFILSSNQGDQLQSALPPFQDLLSSFLWFSHKTAPEGPDARKH